MNLEESRCADYAQGIVTVQPSGQNAIALQPHTDELLQSQNQLKLQTNRISQWRSHYENTNTNEE
jgi:hypothetical protein